MPILSFEGQEPEIDDSSYVFENATVIGNVKIGKNVWIGPGAVLRGDYGKIIIGDFSAIEDNCVVHARPGEETVIGAHATVGHLSVVHTGRIKDWAVIGMGSTISDFAEVGVWAVVAEGAVVKNNSVIPDESIAAGVPAKVIGKIGEAYKKVWIPYKENYNSFTKRYKENIQRI